MARTLTRRALFEPDDTVGSGHARHRGFRTSARADRGHESAHAASTSRLPPMVDIALVHDTLCVGPSGGVGTGRLRVRWFRELPSSRQQGARRFRVADAVTGPRHGVQRQPPSEGSSPLGEVRLLRTEAIGGLRPG